MRCRENTDVDREFFGGTDRTDRLLLNGTQKLDLHGQRQIGNFVEKQRAALRCLKQTLLIATGAREASLHMAKELALHEFARDRTAVHGHEGLFAPWTLFVDETGDHLLARAGFAGDVDGRLTARELADLAAQTKHCGAAADQGGVVADDRRLVG